MEKMKNQNSARSGKDFYRNKIWKGLYRDVQKIKNIVP